MDFRIVKSINNEEKNELSFEINMTPSERNKFRKILLNDLSVVAVDKVLILSNKTLLSNEQLVQRIGLLPINPNLSKIVIERDKCDCEKTCKKCTLYYKFDISFDLTKKNIVYSQDISPLFYPNIYVIPLFETQGKLSGIIKLNRRSPKIHSRWSLPVTFSFKENSNNIKKYKLSCDLPYNLLEVLHDILLLFLKLEPSSITE